VKVGNYEGHHAAAAGFCLMILLLCPLLWIYIPIHEWFYQRRRKRAKEKRETAWAEWSRQRDMVMRSNWALASHGDRYGRLKWPPFPKTRT
jgi:hypothetical protein